MITSSSHLLLVEKDPIQALALTLYLREAGYRVTGAGDHGTALRLSESCWFDLAIISQGPKDRREAGRLMGWLLENRLVPTLLLSSLTGQNLGGKGCHYAEKRVLSKPYTFTGCRRMIEAILAENWLYV